MRIILVRHTSVDVDACICYGQSDVATASTFDEEKNEVAQKLVKEEFQAVYSSPLIRCSKLADFISNGIPVVYDRRLMELNFGTWEGKSWDEISRTDEAKLWFTDWINKPCPLGESYAQLHTRVQEFLQEIYSCNKENILIVTHGGIIRSMISELTNTEPQKAFGLKIDYGSLTKLFYK